MTVFITSCDNQTRERPISSKTENVKVGLQDSVLSATIIKNISDSSIINTTDRTIDILFNGVDNYLGGQRNPKMNFATECMVCEPVQVYEQGFLFGKRLYVTSDSVILFRSDRNIPDTTALIKMTGFYGERKTKKHRFSQGNLSMKYQGQSCMDADFVGVNLAYKKGSLSINKFINASFFEFDLDRDRQPEQFLIGTRNCSQELVLIRINNNTNDK